MKKGFLFGLGILLSGVVLAAVVSVSSIPIKSPGDPLSAAELNQIVGTLEGVSNDGGNVGIGTNQPEVELHVGAPNGGNADIAVEANGFAWTMSSTSVGQWHLNKDIPGVSPSIIVNQNGIVRIGNPPGVTNGIPVCFINGGPDATGLGSCSSSEEYKENVRDLSMDLETIKALRPVEFDWKGSDVPGFGFLAEETHEVDPRLSVVQEDGEILSVRYRELTALLTKAVQEQQKQIELLRSEIQFLKTN